MKRAPLNEAHLTPRAAPASRNHATCTRNGAGALWHRAVAAASRRDAHLNNEEGHVASRIAARAIALAARSIKSSTHLRTMALRARACASKWRARASLLQHHDGALRRIAVSFAARTALLPACLRAHACCVAAAFRALRASWRKSGSLRAKYGALLRKRLYVMAAAAHIWHLQK